MTGRNRENRTTNYKCILKNEYYTYHKVKGKPVKVDRHSSIDLQHGLSVLKSTKNESIRQTRRHEKPTPLYG